MVLVFLPHNIAMVAMFILDLLIAESTGVLCYA
jgi:hypothetical protein